MLRIPPTGNTTFDAASVAAYALYIQRRDTFRPAPWPADARAASEIEYYYGLWDIARQRVAAQDTVDLTNTLRSLGAHLRARGFVLPTGWYSVNAVSAVANAGSATYVVGETMTAVGGAFATKATFLIATLSTGTILTVTKASLGVYSTVPANDVLITGGSGGGAPALTLTWNFIPTP